jgi:hypothetical protein
MTVKQLVKVIFLDPHHLSKCLHRYRKEGLVHICSWTVEDNYPKAVWKAGTGKDAPKPAPMTYKEISLRYRERVKQDPTRRIRRAFNRRKVRSDVAASWVGGSVDA